MKIAMLNYTYGTNGLTVGPPLIINYIDSTLIKADVAKAKALGADYIVCNMHWGKEYTFLPNSYQKTYEALCYRIGVDMVIGGHPHTVQPIVKKKNGEKDQLTVWSLGNFVSNMQTRPTRGGLMVGASIVKSAKAITIKDVHYYLIYVMKKSEGAVTQYYILPDFDYNKFSPGFMDGTNLNHAKNFFEDSRKLFAKENREATEKRVDETSPIGSLFQQLLGSYYAVNIENPDFDLAYHKDIGNLLQITVDEKGQRYLMSGICESIHDAALVKNYIDFLDIGNTDIRKVIRTNEGLIVKEENE
jgi:poly-gamma-glutamate synthesis protein (capsule biosynthesis protein)